jgi:membrane associated rhomboid family serine protease
MNHQEKVALAISDLTSRGMRKSAVAPPLFRLAWKLGVPIRPPHFLGFGATALVMGIPFGIFWGILMWFTVWHKQGGSMIAAIVASAAAGFLFGVLMAAYYRWRFSKLQLPEWSEYEKRG